MTIQTFYPIFEHGQVLTSAQLNNMVDYLEQQDRLSRRTLTGIGIVCGFNFDLTGRQVDISKGVAVTSEGYLITADDQSYDRVRPYVVPVPTAEEATPGEIAEAQYPFLFDGSGNQVPVLELIDSDFVPAPGEDAPRPLTPNDLSNGVVMLFLETERAALKSCDVNDCSDKGAEQRFALRRLLLTRAQADAIIARETEIAGRPSDKGRHPRLELPYMRIEKLALAREGVDNFAALTSRIMVISQKLAGQLPQALRDAHMAYRDILQDLYPQGADPFPDGYFGNLWGQVANNVFLIQYFYDYMRDVAMAYNEFAEAGARFDGECLPNPDRFPKHVLLGDVGDTPDAFTINFKSPSEVAAFSPESASTGAGLSHRPAPRRTHFIPSAAHTGTAMQDVQALFMRMHLLALNFDLRGRLSAPIRVTPSKHGGAPLSDRAIPFYYAFDQGSDLFRNWSPAKTRANLLNTVYSYELNPPDPAHPLGFRIDEEDFYRVEGLVGKPLGTAMAELVAWKRELALNFGIEPVYMRLSTGTDDVIGSRIDIEALSTLVEVMRKLLLCRMSDFDAILLTLLRTLFALLVFIVRGIAAALARVQAGSDGQSDDVNTPSNDLVGLVGRGDLMVNTNTTGTVMMSMGNRLTGTARFIEALPPVEQEKLKQDAFLIQMQLKEQDTVRGDAIKLAVPQTSENSIGKIYEAVQSDDAGGNLFDRTKTFVERQGGDAETTQAVYAQVAMLDQGDQLMRVLNVDRVADFDTKAFDTAYRGFSGAYRNYEQVVVTMPEKAGTTPEATVQIASAADTVASDSTAFAVSNLQDEIGRVLMRVLSGLTLDGFAKRHPGLEHSAGVPVGGTLVLAYVGRLDLQRHLAAISGKFAQRSESLAAVLGSGIALDIGAALRDLEKTVAARTEEPLDDFIVLADFCLPYKCCDSDCSDVELSKSILADPFGRGFSPEPMAVPAISSGPQTDGPTRPTPVDFASRPPLVIVTGEARQPRIRDMSEFERPPNIEEILREHRERNRPVPDPDPAPVEPTPTPERREPRAPTRPTRSRTAVLFGQVVVANGRETEPIQGATVVVELANGEVLEERTQRDGRFKIEVPVGELRIRPVLRGFTSRRQTLSPTGGQEVEIELRLFRLR